MRDRMERLVAFPFSIGCASQSSVAVCENIQPKKAQTEPTVAPTREGESQYSGKTRPVLLSIPIVFSGLQRVIKGLKSLPQLFAIDGEDDDEVEGMVIGFPTDVQHVAHIGWDGHNGMDGVAKSWERPPEFLSPPSMSSKQLELAMANGGPLGA